MLPLSGVSPMLGHLLSLFLLLQSNKPDMRQNILFTAASDWDVMVLNQNIKYVPDQMLHAGTKHQ